MIACHLIAPQFVKQVIKRIIYFWIHAHTLTHRQTNVILDNGSFSEHTGLRSMETGRVLSEVDLLLIVQE